MERQTANGEPINPFEDEDSLPDEASQSLRRRGEVGTTRTSTILAFQAEGFDSGRQRCRFHTEQFCGASRTGDFAVGLG